MNATINTIFARKSVRKFTGASVKVDDLKLIVKAGMAAPSAKNLQPWNFIVVTDTDKLAFLCENLPYAKMLKSASAAIIVCGVCDDENFRGSSFWVQDCSAATQNILLAAESIGLGAVWTAAYPYEERMAPVKKICTLPANVFPLSVIPIGVPFGDEKPKDKYDESKIVWNEY